MNTPAHVLLNLALATRIDRRDLTRPVFWGALLPDLPMFVFYLWERGVLRTPDRVIWSQRYFDPFWQDFIDVFNSMPVAAAALALCLYAGRARIGAFFASMLLHQAMDLPLHREDAHRHFMPFSDFRFVSPVSYWDPSHYGAWAAFAEASLTVGCVMWLWGRFPNLGSRIVMGTVATLQVLVWLVGYGFGRMPDP